MKRYKNILSFEEETRIKKQLSGLKSIQTKMTHKFIMSKDNQDKESLQKTNTKIKQLEDKLELSRYERIERDLL